MQRTVNNVNNVALHTGLKTLFNLAMVEVLLGLIGIAMAISGMYIAKAYLPYAYTMSEGASTTQITYHGTSFEVSFGVTLIAALLGIASGALGMSAVGGHGGFTAARIATIRHQRLAVAHFAMCNSVAVVDFIGFLLFAVRSSPWHGCSFGFGIVPISWILAATFLAHFICSIVSCGFMCKNWCCGGATVEKQVEQQREEKCDNIYT